MTRFEEMMNLSRCQSRDKQARSKRLNFVKQQRRNKRHKTVDEYRKINFSDMPYNKPRTSVASHSVFALRASCSAANLKRSENRRKLLHMRRIQNEQEHKIGSFKPGETIEINNNVVNSCASKIEFMPFDHAASKNKF